MKKNNISHIKSPYRVSIFKQFSTLILNFTTYSIHNRNLFVKRDSVATILLDFT